MGRRERGRSEDEFDDASIPRSPRGARDSEMGEADGGERKRPESGADLELYESGWSSLADLQRTKDLVERVSAQVSVKRRGPAQKQVNRYGTVRENVNHEPDIQYRPLFTYTMIIVLIIVFIFEMYKANFKFEPYSVNPTFGPSSSILLSMGAKDSQKIVNGQWYRLFSSFFLHSGVIHLLLNLIMLRNIGVSIEEVFGHFKVIIIYFLSGLSGSIWSAIFLPNIVTVGASSALYGLLGALFGDFIQNHKTIVSGKWCYFANLVISTLIGLIMGLLPVIDNFAHLGGFICGFLIGLIILTNNQYDENGKPLKPWYSSIATIAASIGLLVFLCSGLGILFQNIDGSKWCPGCLVVDCVKTQWWTCEYDTKTCTDTTGATISC